jgi:ABC-type hemin transport system ATPase subunit
MEKAVVGVLNRMNSKLLCTKQYQTGFKQGRSTGINILRVLEKLKESEKQKKFLLLVDLEKAYDRVNRRLLFEILRKRCKNQQETQICALIEELTYH